MGHHMFTSGMSGTALYSFSLLTFLVAIPSAVKVFNWIATMYKVQLICKPFLLGNSLHLCIYDRRILRPYSGIPGNQYTSSCHPFVLAHFHFIVFGGTGFAFFGAMHYWYPKITGRMYDSKWANTGLLLFFVGFITLYGPMFYLGMKGMPRRYYDYDEIFHAGNIVSSIGSWVLYSGAAIIIIICSIP